MSGHSHWATIRRSKAANDAKRGRLWSKLARRIIAMDDKVDEANRKMFKELKRMMRKNPDTIKRALHLLSTSRHLERIADLATNVCEDVVYMVEGEVIRHKDAIFMDEEIEEPQPK